MLNDKNGRPEEGARDAFVTLCLSNYITLQGTEIKVFANIYLYYLKKQVSKSYDKT